MSGATEEAADQDVADEAEQEVVQVGEQEVVQEVTEDDESDWEDDVSDDDLGYESFDEQEFEENSKKISRYNDELD